MWRELRDRLLRAEVPADGSGLVLNFENAEYFLYYDRQNVFQATRLQDKPTDYRVRAHLRFDEFMRRGRPILQRYLGEREIEHTEFVFNTGDAGWYSLPFLYVNTERHLLVFIRNVPIGPAAVTGVPGLKRGQAVGHLLNSHLGNLLTRPVSSLHRLFFGVTDTAVSSVRFDWATGLSDQPVPALADTPPMDLQDWDGELGEIASLPATKGEVKFLVDGEAFFTRFIDSLTSAQDSIHLQTYIFDNDDFATRIGALLKRRSNEGVEVKILLDGFGTISGTMIDSQSMPEHYTPPASVRWFLESESRVNVRQKANPWFASDHVKSTIVDHEIAFVGGMNIGREYRYDWHDLMMELRGPVVDQIAAEFDIAWTHAGPLGDLASIVAPAAPIKRHTGEEGYPIRILLTRPGIYEIHEAQLEAVRRAQRYIYIQNAYFTDDRMLREIVLARRRGVDVRVIIPLETDFGPISRNNVLAANVMLENGIRVFIYPGFSHVKAAVFDGWACVGSANFDRLSFRLNREMNIAFSHPEAIQQLLEQVFEPDFRASPELTEPFPDRWVDHLVEIIGDFLY
jgi:cardiolipin synthase